MSGVVLPEGWCDTKLGAAIDYGKAVKKELSQVNSDMWILELEDIEKGSSKLLQRVLVADRPFKSTKNSFSKGDILYGKLRPYLNKVIIADTDGVCTTEIIPINGEPLVNNKFLFYWLRSESFLSYVNAVSYGVNMPRLGTTDGLAAPFYLAPLSEQKVIVEKLDELLAQVDILKTRLTTIPTLLKRFRQSVLAAAVSGKLTEEWRGENVFQQNTNLLKAEKERLIKNKDIKKDLLVKEADHLFEIPEAWLFLELQSFATKITDGEHSTPQRESSGHYLLSARNVRDGFIDLSKVDYVGDAEYKKLRARCDPNKGDILISCSGSVGRVAIVDFDDSYVMVRSAALVKTLADFIDNRFVMYVLQSLYLQKQIEEKSRSTAQANLFLGQIKELAIPFPPLQEQTEIVRRVEQLFAFADQIEQQVKNAQSRVNNLTQSILAKAFRGELTADWRAANPDLITGENSAQALLAKIKADKTKRKA